MSTETAENKKEGGSKKTHIYVRNLPTWTTKDQFESVFSEIGPLRRCILITNKGEKECKGYGFVHYAFEEDAKKAMQKLQGKPFMTSTNLMVLDWANKRDKVERKVKKDDSNTTSTTNTEENSSEQSEEKKKKKTLPKSLKLFELFQYSFKICIIC